MKYLDFIREVYSFRKHFADEVLSDKRRQSSKSLVESVHEHFPDKTRKCKTDLSCLFTVYKEMLKSNETVVSRKEFIRKVKDILDHIIPNLNSRSQAFTKYNNATSELNNPIYNYAKEIFKLDERDRKTRINSQNEALNKRHKNITSFNEKNIHNIITNPIMKRSDNLIDMIVLCQLASGARLIEILKVSQFSKGKDRNHIIVSGIAKKRDINKSNLEIERCLLGLTSDQFIKKINEIRLYTAGDLTNVQLTNRYNLRVIKRIKEFLPNATGSHDLRRIWANYTYPHCNTGESLNAYIANKLGHIENNISTSLSYTNIKIQKPLDDEEQKDEEPDDDDEEPALIIGKRYNTELVTIANLIIKMYKQPKLRDGKQMQRLLSAVETLKKNDVKVTRKLLKALGYGNRVISEWYKEYGKYI